MDSEVSQSIARLEKHIEMMQDPHPRAFFHDGTADGADCFKVEGTWCTCKADQLETIRDTDAYIAKQKSTYTTFHEAEGRSDGSRAPRRANIGDRCMRSQTSEGDSRKYVAESPTLSGLSRTAHPRHGVEMPILWIRQ